MPTYEIIDALRSTPGTLAKLDILNQNKFDHGLSEFLRRTYEPRITYFITPQPYTGAHTGAMDLLDAYPFLDAFAARKITGNAAKTKYAEIMHGLSRENAALFNMILGRDIRAGIAEKQINKVWPKLISTTPYMRCVLPKQSKLVWDGSVKYSQTKEDGEFANITVTGPQVEITTRNGSVFPIVPWMSSLLDDVVKIAEYMGGEFVQFHGELLVYKDGKVLPRKTGNGILNSVLQTGESPAGDYELVYVCWDAVALADIIIGRGTTPYRDRLKSLRDGVDSLNQYSETPVGFFIVETREITNKEEAIAHNKEVMAKGGEGTVIKSADMVWFDGDNPLQVKMKLYFEVDLKIIDFIEGTGKNVGRLGAFVVATEDGGLVSGVGTGIKDSQRKEFWEDRANLKDKIISVGANDIISSKTDASVLSLFLPRFTALRLDKNVADTTQRAHEILEAAKEGGI